MRGPTNTENTCEMIKKISCANLKSLFSKIDLTPLFVLQFIFCVIPVDASVISGGNAGIRVDTIDKLLFYIQRSVDSSVVVYQLNTDKSGKPDFNSPINVFWLSTSGAKTPLTAIQQKFSYGIEIVQRDSKRNSFVFVFAGYDKRMFSLMKSVVDERYHVYSNINAAYGIVNRIFINITGGTFWFPVISYVTLCGTVPSTGMKQVETIIPRYTND